MHYVFGKTGSELTEFKVHYKPKKDGDVRDYEHCQIKQVEFSFRIKNPFEGGQ